MTTTKIAVISFPGNNCEVESIRSIREAGMEPVYFRWNDDRKKLENIDGYFVVGGFSYEDRGRSGMVAGRDALMEFIGREAAEGKVVIGNCNGAQILIESGLVPLGSHLDMSLAHNAIAQEDGYHAPGFLSEWVWMTPTCARDRCATADWKGAMHLPIAHGEGRFTTKDASLMDELKENDQIAFSYCDAEGNVSVDPHITPNGSLYAIAGICNPAGNVVAIMPHPERTPNGAPYFASMKKWIEKKRKTMAISRTAKTGKPMTVAQRVNQSLEIFIESIIVNNEERTVESIARKYDASLRLTQFKYLSLASSDVRAVLVDLTRFNANKERALVRLNGKMLLWNAARKELEPVAEEAVAKRFGGTLLLRRDEPDTGAHGLPQGSHTGVCYAVRGAETAAVLANTSLLEVFCNPHASSLELLRL